MKKIVLLSLIAMLACGAFAVDYYRVIVQVFDGTNYLGVYDFTGPLNGSTPFVSSGIINYSTYFGTYTVVSPAPVGWYWESTQYTDLDNINDFAQDPNNPELWTAYVTFRLLEEDQEVPVELSSFTATLTALNDVQINWISQSESNLMGYRVYRNETHNQTSSVLITPIIIPATNTSQQQNYTVVDNEVEIGGTYYYWLESVEANYSKFYGPVSIKVEGEVPPIYPEVTSLKNAYPNPFRANASTNINVELKEGENGTVTIYNLQGKVVKAYDVTPCSHTITWNGTDTNGNACSSGIYLYKLSTPSANATKRMVIIK